MRCFLVLRGFTLTRFILRFQSEVSSRMVNTLLTELDGIENRKQVYIIAATNRPGEYSLRILFWLHLPHVFHAGYTC